MIGLHLLKELRHRGFIGDIGAIAIGDSGCRQGCHRLAHALVINIDHRHHGTLGLQGLCDGKTQAARGAGDSDVFSL